MSEMIIHVGMHKTASNWLEKSLLIPQSGKTIHFMPEKHFLRSLFVRPMFNAFCPEKVLPALSGPIATAKAAGLPLFMQDEALAGSPFVFDKFRQGVTLQRIKQALPDAKIVLTIREQASILHSVYGHYVRGGGTATLRNFLMQPDNPGWEPISNLDYYDYNFLNDFCNETFGEDRFLMIPMEWMIKEPQDMLVRISDHFGLDWRDVEPDQAGRVHNPAWSGLAYESARILNHLQTGLPRWTVKKRFVRPNNFASRVDRWTPGKSRQRQKTQQLALIREILGDRYAQSNATLSKAIGIDLDTYGYQT